MKTITIKEKQYSVPTTWIDVRLNQFLKMKEIEDNIDEMEFYDHTLSILSVLTGCPFEDLETMTPEDLGNLSTTLVEILSSPTYEVKDIGINLNGELFIFDTSPNKMVLGQFIDLELFSQDGNVWENAHKIAAVFWRFPKKIYNKNKDENSSPLSIFDKARLKAGKKINFSKFLPEDYNAANTELNAEYFKDNLPMPYIYTAVVFFCALRNQYNKFMVRSLKVKEKKEKKKIQTNGQPIKRNGTGTQQ